MKRMMELYGKATCVFVDYEDYSREECIFYYRILEKVTGAVELPVSNYFISELKAIMEQPEFLHKALFETRFFAENQLRLIDIAKKLNITKQGLLLRFEEGYEYIRKQDNRYDISKRIAILNQAIAQLQKVRETHGLQYRNKKLSIETLPLKQRTYTCLKSGGVSTIAQFMALKESEARNIPGVGEKTVYDIIENQRKLMAKFNNTSYKEFDISLEGLGLGARAIHCLRRIGVKTIEEFTKLTKEDVLKAWHVGEKTWQEIYQKQQMLKYGDI